MSAEEWDEIKRLFSSALALPEEDREEFLAKAAGDRSQLLRTVLDLLANHWDATNASLSDVARCSQLLTDGEVVANRYRIVRFIARGGMGEVYEAYDERLRSRLAMKTLRSELVFDKEALARFERELLIARDVAHEGLCKLFDLVEHKVTTGTVPCLTMELLEGESLADYLARERPLEVETALPLIKQIGAAMSTLHGRFIIHRDLKPSNVMLANRYGRTRQAVVTDFGLAKMKNSEYELFESQVDVQAGAPYFMAPELLRRQKPSVASDIYAFGLLIDEMVTERRAFSAESLQALYFAKLWESPISPAERTSKELPATWNETILRCLECQPSDRFATVAEVVEALEAPKMTRRRKFVTRRMALASGTAASLLVGASAAGLLSLVPPRAVVGVFDIENRISQEFDYLCRGTIAELMRRLGSRDSIETMRVYGSGSPAKKPRLYRFALDGVLAGSEGAVRLTMRLLDTDDKDKIVWSEPFDCSFDGPLGRRLVSNFLELQAEIAAHAVTALEGTLGIGYRMTDAWRRWRGRAFATGTPTSSNVAFDHFLRGQTLLQESTPASVPAAVECFERAVAEDPHFALAFAALSQAHLSWMNFDQEHSEELGRKARTFADRALQQDRQLAEAFAAMGAVRQFEWDWDGARESYAEALRLKPRFPRALRWLAGLVLQFGNFDDAIRGMERAQEVDPYDRTSASGHGLALLFAGRTLDAIKLLEEAVAGRELVAARHNLAQAYARHAFLLGNSSQSDGYFARALEQGEVIARWEGPVPQLSTEVFALAYSLKGDTMAAVTHVRKLEHAVNQKRRSPVRLAWIYAIQGDVDSAIGLLERALVARDASLSYVKVNPFLERARNHPRFEAIISAMKLD